MRRRWIVGAVVLAACTTSTAGDPAAVPRSTTTSTAIASTTAPAEPVSQWKPGTGEPAVAVKLAASRAVEILGNFSDGGGGLAAGESRLRVAGLEPGFALSASRALLGDGRGRVMVVYPQLAGLTATEAAVMVVADVRPRTGTRSTPVRRTLDVRVAKRAAGWVATALASDGGEPPSAGAASADARRVLDDRRVGLTDTARWDLEAGRVDDRVVRLLNALSARWRLDVSVFSSGHPVNVFDTERMSNHTAGRAVDIWAVDGQPVAIAQSAPVLREIVQAALDGGATEIGAPFDLDGPGGLVFTNVVHQDHLHFAFDR